MSNPSAQSTPVKIIQGQNLTGGAQGNDPNCYTLDTQGYPIGISTIVTLPPMSTYTAYIGTCTNMTLDVQIETLVNGALGWGECATYSSDFVDASVNSGVNLPSNVQTVINVAVDQITTQQASVNSQLYQNTLNIMNLMASAYGANSGLQQLIQGQIAGIQAASYNPANFSAIFTDGFNLNSTAYANAMANASASVLNVYALNNNITDLNNQNKNLSNVTTTLINQNIALSKNISDSIAYLQNLVNNYASVTGGPGGSGGGSSAISAYEVLGLLAFIFDAMYILYYLYTNYKSNKSKKKDGNTYAQLPAKTGDEGEILDSHQQAARESVKKRIHVNWLRQSKSTTSFK